MVRSYGTVATGRIVYRGQHGTDASLESPMQAHQIRRANEHCTIGHFEDDRANHRAKDDRADHRTNQHYTIAPQVGEFRLGGNVRKRQSA